MAILVYFPISLLISYVLTESLVLHAWSSITGPRIAYPASYIHVYEQIASKAISNVNVHNKWNKETPLNLLATIYHTEDEFKAACDILWSLGGPTQVDIDAADNRGMTPIFCALQSSDIDASGRGIYLLRRGASLTALADELKDIFYALVWNRSLSDSQCYNLTIQILAHVEGSPPRLDDEHDNLVLKYKPVYQSHFQPFSSEERQRASLLSIWVAATSGRLLTTRLLLDLASPSKTLLNEPTVAYRRFFRGTSSRDPPETLLDRAILCAEDLRRLHIDSLRLFKAGVARERAITQNLAFDSVDILFPEHAAEKLANMGGVLRMLRHEYGAKKAIEMIPEEEKQLRTDIMNQQFYFVAGGPWDLTVLYECGYTPETQPQRDEWRILYELSTYCEDFDEKLLEALKSRYIDEDDEGEWRPHIKLLKTAVPVNKTPDTEVFTRVRDRLLPRILSMFKELGKVDEEGRVWIEACDETSISAEAKWEVEVLDGGNVGKTRKIKK